MNERIQTDKQRENPLVANLKGAGMAIIARAGLEMAGLVDDARRWGKGAALSAIDAVDAYAKSTEDYSTTMAGTILHEGAKRIRKGLITAKKSNLIDVLNIQKLPKLLDDEEKDFQLKAQMVDILNSDIGTMSTFYDLIVFISSISFNQGVPSTRLTAFFESERILKLILQKIFEGEYSGYRSTNLLAATGSVARGVSELCRYPEKHMKKKELDEKTRKELDEKLEEFQGYRRNRGQDAVATLVERLKIQYLRYDLHPWLKERIPSFAEVSKANKQEKKTVDEDTRKDLERKLKRFKEKDYNPTKNYTMAVFVERLKAKYPEYDLRPWLEEQMPFFIEMLRGYIPERTEEGENKKNITGVQHLRNMIQGAYEEKTRTRNLHAEFIKTHLGDFFMTANPRRIEKPEGNQSTLPLCVINLGDLNKFFRKLKRVKTHGTSEGQMINIIAETCSAEARKYEMAEKGVKISVYKGETEETITVRNPKDINGKIAEIIDQAIKVSSPDINNQSLLVNPGGTPERIKLEYATIFDANGNVKQREYNALLKDLFGHKGAEKPYIATLNKELRDIFENAEVEMPKEIDDILKIDEYAEIVRAACTEKDGRKKWAGRVKLENIWLKARVSRAPRVVFMESDARKVKAKMEATPEDIQIDHNTPAKLLKFIDHKNGDPEILNEREMDAATGNLPADAEVREVRLIPTKLSGQNCHLMQGNDKEHPNEYLNLKSPESIIIQMIRAQTTDPNEVTDLIRMTFVVDNIEDLNRLKENVETSHARGGRLIRWEDKYNTETQENDEEDEMLNPETNESKSKNYKTLRAVVYVPISGEGKEYHVKVEIRILLPEDVAKVESQYHEVGHKAYNHRRSLKCIKILAPIEIFPELYEEEEKDPDSLSNEVNIRVRQALANTVSLDSQAQETPLPASLPVS